MARTHRALVQALIDLVPGKPWYRITVQNLLDRARVARSTFYAHYRGKEDLLLRSFEHMLELLDGGIADGRIAPVRELFEHVGASRSFHRALVRAKVIDRLYQVGAERLSTTIERRLGARRGGVPAPVAAHAHAGALFALLRWWLAQDEPPTPARMDEMFHRLVG